MKAIIDQQIDMDVDHPICYGLLVEGKQSFQIKLFQKAHCEFLGYDCYLYRMTMQYEAEYRSQLIAPFRTLRDSLDAILLIPAFQIMSYLDVIICIFLFKK
jgi:hypothetical protein